MNISDKKARSGAVCGMAALMTACLVTGCTISNPMSASQPSDPQNAVSEVTPAEDPSSAADPGLQQLADPEDQASQDAVTEPVTEPEEKPEGETIPEEIPEPEPQTVTILGTEYSLDETYLDLSDMSSMDTYMVATAISGMENLSEVNLMKDDGTTKMDLQSAAVLKSAAPGAHFIFSFDLFGKTVTTEDRIVEFVNTGIGNEGEETIRQALTVLDRCRYFLLDDCGIDDEVMDGIRSDYPDTKVVWRIHVGTRSALTDDQVIRMTHGINDSMTGPLRYCNEVMYMDLGHDSGITDISFTAYMPCLECIILSDAKFRDLTPLTNCPKLTWVELVYCDKIQDISVIAGMESIRFLNISYTYTRDISSLWDMKLDRFSCIANGVPEDVQNSYREAHPDCLAVFSGNPYGYAWRYNDYGYHFFDYYTRMREVFRYDQGSPGGFKLPEYVNPAELPDEETVENPEEITGEETVEDPENSTDEGTT